MRRQLRNVIMLVPVVLAGWLTYRVEPPMALPVDQVVALEFNLPEAVAEDRSADEAVQVAQADVVSE